MRIAAYVNGNGEVSGLYEDGKVVLFERRAEGFKPVSAFSLGLQDAEGLSRTRERLRAVGESLGDCKVLIAREVKGLPYTILEGFGFSLWKGSGPVEEQLEHVERMEAEAREAASRPKPTPVPVGDIRDGNFRIHLPDVLAADSRLSSKQVLIPFLEKTAYQRLEILCDHPPRWFGPEFERLKAKALSAEKDGETGLTRIVVVPSE
jgi:Fe-only nitrogenase accessory protein AnfO